MTDTMQKIATNLYKGEDEEVAELVQEALDQGMAPGEILASGLIAGMDEVGRDFKAGDLFVPEVLMASAGKYIIGTVQGDLHDIGKNLVKMMLEGAGFQTIDLGTNIKPEEFVAAVREHQPQLLGMSALLTTTMPGMKATIEALEEAGLRDAVKIMVGGAPVTAAFAEQIGADAYAPDAGSAVAYAPDAGSAVDVARSLAQ